MPKQNFNEKLIARLKTNPDFIDESGELLPAAVKDHAWKLDHSLIKLLLSDPEIKSTFFDEIDGHWVFNHNTFISYINQKNFLANSYTQFRNKIGLNIDGKFLRERGEVSLVWPYKDCVLEGGQTKEEEKRKEIFFNEILAQDEINRMFDPKVLTNWKRHTAAGEQDVTDIQRDENGTIRENLIIKGNNLIALHTLKQQFRGQVKLIYIDPPNWGGESRREDAKNCFYPVIVENGEVVGFGNVLDDDKHPSGQTVACGEKDFVYPIDQNMIERKWRYARQSVDEIKHLLRARETETGYEIELGKDFGMYRTVWEDKRYDANIYGTQLVKSLVPDCEFDFPKSLWNVYDCLRSVIEDDKEAIILDFFGGSGTTAHAVLELNKDGGSRKFIICEQMHYVETVTRKRVKKVIGQDNKDDFIYCELMQYNQTYMDKIQSAQSSEELVALWQDIAENSFLNWYVNAEMPQDAIDDFIAIDNLEAQKHCLIELLDKNQLYINLSEINDADFAVSEEDKTLNKKFYGE